MNPPNIRFVSFASTMALAVGAAAGLAGCTVERAEANRTTGQGTLVARAAEPSSRVTVLGSGDPAELALTASQTFFSSAPVVVLAPAEDAVAQGVAEVAAVQLAGPVLLVGGSISGDGLRRELARLGTVAVVDVREDALPPGQRADSGADATGPAAGADDAPLPDASSPLDVPDDVEHVRLDPDALTPSGELDQRDLGRVLDALPARGEPDVLTEVLVLTEAEGDEPAAVATARAAGAVPLEVPTGDPRATSEVVEAISSAKALAVVGIGAGFGTSEQLGWRIAAAETGTVLANGTQLAFAQGTRYVVVGADDVTGAAGLVDGGAAAADRAVAAAERFAAQDADAVTVPVLEVGATRVSSLAGEDGDYSAETVPDALLPVLEAASGADVPVLLRLEPGTGTFDEQVAEYADLLARPDVGVVLDARGRYVDGRRSGVVEPAEVQAALDAVAATVREHGLPQKLVVLQTSDPAVALGAVGPDGGPERDGAGLDTGDGEVALVVQPVGAGGYGARAQAWAELDALLDDVSPDGVRAAWTTGSSDPALDVAGVLALDPVPQYVAGR